MSVYLSGDQEVQRNSHCGNIFPGKAVSGVRDLTSYHDKEVEMNLHCGNIFSRKAVGGVRDQHARLPHCPVPHHNAPKNHIKMYFTITTKEKWQINIVYNKGKW